MTAASDPREKARRKWTALLNMTTARGCTAGEAATAARLAAALDSKWGFSREPKESKPDFEERFARAESKAAARYQWEYRKCGKSNCHCVNTKAGRGHGPYRYSKKRSGKKVVSVYVGK